MSQWTHVIGSIQCGWSKEKAEEKLGKPVLWSDANRFEYGSSEYQDYLENVWKKAFKDNEEGKGIPMGSEGSIEWYYVNTTEGKDYTILGEGALIAIQGDLRNFGGDEKIQLIIDWFENAVKEVRFATLTIKDEWDSNYIAITSYWGHCYIIKYKPEKNDDFE